MAKEFLMNVRLTELGFAIGGNVDPFSGKRKTGLLQEHETRP
jgi:hypothetical protein